MPETKVTVCDGKYTITHTNGAGLKALRNGEPWGRDLVGDGLVLALVNRVAELEEQEQKYKGTIDHYSKVGQNTQSEIHQLKQRVAELGEQYVELNESHIKIQEQKEDAEAGLRHYLGLHRTGQKSLEQCAELVDAINVVCKNTQVVSGSPLSKIYNHPIVKTAREIKVQDGVDKPKQ